MVSTLEPSFRLRIYYILRLPSLELLVAESYAYPVSRICRVILNRLKEF